MFVGTNMTGLKWDKLQPPHNPAESEDSDWMRFQLMFYLQQFSMKTANQRLSGDIFKHAQEI